jgi:hypothetical protein
LFGINTKISDYFHQEFFPAPILIYLIISCNAYVVITSSDENQEMALIADAVAQVKNVNGDTSNKHADIELPRSDTTAFSSPPSSMNPISSTFSSTTPTASVQSVVNHLVEDKVKDLMTAFAINEGDLVHVLWQDDTPEPGFTPGILHKRDGADFDPTTVNLTPSSLQSTLPAIAVSGNNVHVAWRDVESNDLFYRRSTDGGALFGTIINLSNNADISDAPAIALSGNNVHIVWEDLTGGNYDILYRRSTDGGASFTDPTKNLSNNAGTSISPAIATVGNSVHVVWSDDTSGGNEILYRRSVNNGSTFPNTITNLSDNLSDSTSPAIAASGNNVHVAWQDIPLSAEILYRRSLDGGSTFPNVIKNLSGNVGASLFPAIAVSSNSVHVIWSDTSSGNQVILHRRSLDNGNTFPNEIKNISNNQGPAEFSAIALSGANVYVVWTNSINGFYEIVYGTSSNNGNTFSTTLTNLSANAGESKFPAIAVS